MYNAQSCLRCQTLPFISKEAGNILVSCDVPELATKCSLYCEKLGLSFHFEDGHTLWISVDSFKAFLVQLLESRLFDAVEQEAISFLFLPTGTPFSPSKIREAKSIEKYKDLLAQNESLRQEVVKAKALAEAKTMQIAKLEQDLIHKGINGDDLMSKIEAVLGR